VLLSTVFLLACVATCDKLMCAFVNVTVCKLAYLLTDALTGPSDIAQPLADLQTVTV
jgi:hypothetical protein